MEENESVEINYGNTVRQESTSIDQGYDIKDGCEAGDDVWTGDSSDDKEAGVVVRSSKNENAKIFFYS